MTSESPESPAPTGDGDPDDEALVHPGPREEGGAGGMATRELARREHVPSPGRRD